MLGARRCVRCGLRLYKTKTVALRMSARLSLPWQRCCCSIRVALRSCAGMLLSNQFPVNYFSISEVEQMFPDFEARLDPIFMHTPFAQTCFNSQRENCQRRCSHDPRILFLMPCLYVRRTHTQRMASCPATAATGGSTRSTTTGPRTRTRPSRPSERLASSGVEGAACLKSCLAPCSTSVTWPSQIVEDSCPGLSTSSHASRSVLLLLMLLIATLRHGIL